MKNSRIPLIALSLSGALAIPTAQASNISVGSNTWTASGAAGLIYGDSTVHNSPTGNAQFGYVSTSGGVYGVSPLVLRDEGRGTENQTNGSKIQSNAFNASANDTLTLQFNYVSTDGRGYDDYAWARLVNADTNNTIAWLFTARSTNSANGNVVPGNVLNRQLDNNLPDELDAVLNDGNTVGFDVAGTNWIPLGSSSGICWDNANTCGPTGWIKSAYSFAASGSYFLEFGVINWGDEAFDTALAFDFGGLQQVNFSGVTLVPPPATVPLPGGFFLMSVGVGLMHAMSRKNKFRGQA
ncbi:MULTISPECIES: NF038132 family protein [Methylomonas]|nr:MULTISPECIES: NF038132 family protein [Methylomonas]OAH96073.1 hypothetical protein A1342_14215 [Methylomonas methanica]TCV81361.1 hypothetical protein EDE11_11562 [Methylomonas methanica]